jgi:hypothetical protein
MSLIARLKNVRKTVFRTADDKRATRRSRREGASSEETPIKPIEPLEQTQSEVPKVGTTDAPGG